MTDELRLESQDLRLLKAILGNPLLASEFASTYDYNLFVGDAKPFAKAVLEFIKAYKTPPTPRVMLEQFSNDKKLCNTIEEIYQVLDNVEIDVNEYRYDLDKLKNRYTISTLRNVREYLASESGDLDKQIQEVQRQLDRTKQVRTGQRQAYIQQSLKNYLPEFNREFLAKIKNPQLDRGIMTGYKFFDFIKNGMSPAEMMIVAAETGGGKSLLLNNLAIQMWMQQNTILTTPDCYVKGHNVLYFSLEMPFKACFRRTMCRVAEINSYAMRDAKLNTAQAQRLSAAGNFIKNYPYEFEIVDIPRGVTVEEIENRFLEACNKYHPEIVVVDYLGLMEDRDFKGDDWLKLGYIAGKLHEFARIYNVILLTAVQLNRVPQKQKEEGENANIGVHRIGRSSLIMHHANVGIQIQTRKNEKSFNDMKCHIIKNRDGELGEFMLKKNLPCATLLEGENTLPEDDEENKENILPANIDDITEILKKNGWYE